MFEDDQCYGGKKRKINSARGTGNAGDHAGVSLEVGIEASLTKKMILGQRIGRDKRVSSVHICTHLKEEHSERTASAKALRPSGELRRECQRCIREARKGRDQGRVCLCSDGCSRAQK